MPLPVTLGRTKADEVVSADLAALPHLLVAGTTGSGKSVFLNSLLVQLIAMGPREVNLMLIDPKRVEFMPYRDLTHVYNTAEDAEAGLEWLAGEMNRRFELLDRFRARDIDGLPLDDRPPRFVCVIDELASLMLGPRGDAIEQHLTVIAQMSRAAGIHLILATQRPTTNVVTGLLKANIPARVSFLVISRVDSLVILDNAGAEGLRGKGDMLVRIPGEPVKHLQGDFVGLDRVEAAVAAYTEVH